MIEENLSYEQALLHAQLEIQEESLRTISQEIHDNIGQVLSLAKLQLNTLPVKPLIENAAAITTTKELVSKAIADLRSLSKSLHPNRVNELGLEENIRQELQMLEKTRQLETHFKVTGSPYKIPVQTQTILFRMVQEAISNIIKHAAATRVEVILHYEQHQFCLMVRDNGRGIAPEIINGRHEEGMGLRNMKTRSAVIGATFELGTADGGGTLVRVCLPVES